jgi:hypothetical protein
MADALKACHYGFSFIWNDGVHSVATASLENILLEQYQTALAKNVSYPAFTNFSLDNNYGDGRPTHGTSSGCVNCGWVWKLLTDTTTSWSASFKNSQVATKSTTDVTARNLQHFSPKPGTALRWWTSTGQKGTVLVDSYGLVTVKGVEVTSSADTVLTIQ